MSATTKEAVSFTTSCKPNWKVFVVGLIMIILILAIFCTMMGSSFMGLVLASLCLLVVVYILIPPVYSSTGAKGSGKWVYSSTGSTRFDPDTLAHADAQEPLVTPRGTVTSHQPLEKEKLKQKKLKQKKHTLKETPRTTMRMRTSPPRRKIRTDCTRYSTDASRPPLPHVPPVAALRNRQPPHEAALVPNNAYGHTDGAQLAQAVWRSPQYPVAEVRSSRAETIADVVPDLPSCSQQTPKQIIRNQGLYGIKGDWRCDRFQRSTYQDTRFVEPIGARNEFLSYNAYDQLHARDMYMSPVSTADAPAAPAILHRNPDPFGINT